MTCETQSSTEDLILAETPNLRRLAHRLTRCKASADDHVQETLLRAWVARDRYEPGTSIRAWTSTILRRVFLTRAMSEKRRRLLLSTTDTASSFERVAGRPVAPVLDEVPRFEVLKEELDGGLRRALELLPEYYRQPFFMHAVKHLTCAEIASQLAVPEGTVMSRIHRARTRLKRELHGRRQPARASSSGAVGRS